MGARAVLCIFMSLAVFMWTMISAFFYRVIGHNAEQITGDHQNDVYTILIEDVYTDFSSLFFPSNMTFKFLFKN